MKGIYCDNKSLSQQGYCSYYGETYYALKEVLDIEYKQANPNKISDLGKADYIILGYGHTDSGYGKPSTLIRNSDVKLFSILNKEYAGLNYKLDWIKEMKPTAALTVHHDIDSYIEYTGVPFHRIMWSANEELFRNYGGEYESDLFFSGVTRPEQTENLRERILTNMSRLSDYKLSLNIRSHRTNYSGSIFSPEDYAKKLSSSKICFITTGPVNLVGTRYFEVMAGNRSLILCNRMDDTVYGNMLIDGYNCVMFSNEDEFFEKAIYYLENEDERMTIVNTAYKDFIDNQTWNVRSNEIKSIIEGYLK